MPVPDVSALDDVDAGRLFAALALLGQPTVYYHPDRDRPQDQDMPQILGALTAAVERIAVHRQVWADPGAGHAFAAGYLQTVGAASPCGARQAFDMVTLRLRATDELLAGHRAGGAMPKLVQLCNTAARAFAVASAVATNTGDDTSRGKAAQLITARIAEGNAALSRAREVLGQVLAQVCERAGVDVDELPGADGRTA